MNWRKFCRFCENLGNYTLWRIFLSILHSTIESLREMFSLQTNYISDLKLELSGSLQFLPLKYAAWLPLRRPVICR